MTERQAGVRDSLRQHLVDRDVSRLIANAATSRAQQIREADPDRGCAIKEDDPWLAPSLRS